MEKSLLENQIYRKELLSGYSFQIFSFILIFLFSIGLHAQRIQIIDGNKEGLEAVWIYNLQNSNSTFSDKGGYALLKDVSRSDSLVFEHLGFKTISITFEEVIEKGTVIQMEEESTLLNEVTVVGRADRNTSDVISETAVITAKNLRLTNPQTTADAMANMGEVFVQKSQMGGGSPVMRGFEANRILLVVDGIRMNNAIYRNGHLQNAITIDPEMLSNMELIFGPASLSYGSDALGGVIHFRTRQAKFNFQSSKKYSQQFQYNVRYASANMEKSAHLSWNAGWNNIAFLTGISFSDYGDLRAGNRRPQKYPDFGKRNEYVERIDGLDQVATNENPNVQLGSAYHQLDAFQKMRIRLSENMTFSTNLQYSTSSDIPRYDALTERSGESFKYAEWYYGPQNRFLASARLDYLQSNLFFDRLIAIAASQNIKEDRHNRKMNNPIVESTLEDIDVYSLTLDLDKRFNNRHKLIYGMDFQANYLDSKGRGENIWTGTYTSDVLSRYPDQFARLWNYGAYLNYNYEGAKIDVNTGIRWNQNIMEIAWQEDSPIVWPEYFYSGIDSKSEAFAYSVGMRYKASEWTKYKINLSSAFRTPNIDDLSKVRVKNGEMLVPNPDLQAEVAYNAELSINHIKAWFGYDQKISAGVYFSRLENAIVRQDFQLPDGRTQYFDGKDSLSIVANVNADKVFISGMFYSIEGKLFEHLAYGGRLNASYGRILDDEGQRPAEHIPPVFGSIYLKYEYDKMSIRLSTLFNGEKDIDDYGGSVDNPEYATADGSYAWAIFNLHTSYMLNDLFRINAGIENILDKHYRPFASGLSGPGINFLLGLRGNF